MKYKKINDATVQCIISKEDMDQFGLTVADIFERNERGESFLRQIISNAYDAVGYEANGGNIAMQITPLQDRGLVITFSDEGPLGLQTILEHIKRALTGTGLDLQKLLEQLHAPQEQEDAKQENKDGQQEQTVAGIPDHAMPERVFAFESMGNVISFCRGAFGEQRMGSSLYKDGGTYYLVLEKKRMSWRDFNKVSMLACDFSTPLKGSEDMKAFLEEHAECVIGQQAVGNLKKVF